MRTIFALLTCSCALINCAVAVQANQNTAPIILTARNPAVLESLAAREICRYLYLRTGVLIAIQQNDKPGQEMADGIIVAQKDREIVKALGNWPELESLAPQQFLLKTIKRDTGEILLIAGGDLVGTLYGAYRFAEHLGVRFYLHGDVVPDEKIPLELPRLDERGQPLFALRGIQPFHDFPEGPDWWNLDDYKAIFAQLPKLRMNFFGLHTYPEGGPNAEPTTWIGLPGDIGEDGKVRFSYRSSYQNTLRGNWGYSAVKTSEFVCGSSELFDRDDYGADVMQNNCPAPQSTEASNDVFHQAGLMLREAFRSARQLEIKTCLGTETPLTVPSALQDRLKALGKDRSAQETIEELYSGIFKRIVATHDLDYYWLWTPENWTWQGASETDVQATTRDLQAALNSLKKSQASFQLATCGWVLGPQNDRALFDKLLPKDVPVSCINREVGMAPIDAAFGQVTGRPKWAIPWLEDDPALTSPQLWVGRMRRDAADALRYGCEGLMGIHWRTRILGPAVSALAQAAWDQSIWKGSVSDASQRPRVAGPVGGRSVNFPELRIENSDEGPLYQTMRMNVTAYRFSLPNGTYSVTLKFAEPQFRAAGRRVFDVKIQGKMALEKLDIFERVGQNKAFHHTVQSVSVNDGWLDIDFIPRVDVPVIAAIAVVGPEYSQKINCGDGQFRDYQNDLSTNYVENPSTSDFYRDWTLVQFGPEAGPKAAGIFERMDSQLPRPSDWVDGPGGLKPDLRPWAQVKDEYRFVDELEALRSSVQGPGNLERFDFWLNNFRYMKAMAQVNCSWAEYNRAMEKVKAEKEPEARKTLARRLALPLRIELVRQVERVFNLLLSFVSNPGEMGTIANWNQHILPGLLMKPGLELARFLGEELPAEANPSMKYHGPMRVFLPTLRGSVGSGEALAVKGIILAEEKPKEAFLYWRRLGEQDFRQASLSHQRGGVYSGMIPSDASSGNGLEYFVKVTPASGEPVFFPASAPALNQTVVVVPEGPITPR